MRGARARPGHKSPSHMELSAHSYTYDKQLVFAMLGAGGGWTRNEGRFMAAGQDGET